MNIRYSASLGAYFPHGDRPFRLMAISDSPDGDRIDLSPLGGLLKKQNLMPLEQGWTSYR